MSSARRSGPGCFPASARGSALPSEAGWKALRSANDLADDAGDRSGDVIDVLGIEGRHADPPGLNGVDRVLLAQAQHLVARQPRVAEQPLLLLHEAPVLARARLD